MMTFRTFKLWMPFGRSVVGKRLIQLGQAQASHPPQAEIKRLLILRPDNLGDVVLFSGAFRHLRALYPQAEITVYCLRYVRNLLEECPYIDHLIAWEDVFARFAPTVARWACWDRMRNFRGGTRLRRYMSGVAEACDRISLRLCRSRYRADVLLVPARSPSKACHDVAALLPAPQKIGIAGDCSNQSRDDDAAGEKVYTARMRLAVSPADHEFLATRDFLRFLGAPQITTADLWPELWMSAADRQWAREQLRPGPGCIRLAVCPGGNTFAGKIYPAAGYAAAISQLAEQRFQVMVFGAESESALCRDVVQSLRGCCNVSAIQDFCGQTTVRQMVAAIDSVDAVIAPDNAALHVAIALHKPSVGIVGGGHFGRFQPWGNENKNRVACLPMDCFGCNWRCRYATVRCIAEIPPRSIAHELQVALGNLPAPRRSTESFRIAERPALERE